MTMKILLFIVVALILGAFLFWWLLPHFLEQPKYKVIDKQGNLEIRQYQQMLLTSITTKGAQREALGKGFVPLARYIGAKDRDGQKISMTAPVMQTQGDETGEWIVSFSMPSQYHSRTLPTAKNTDIFMREFDPNLTAVSRFSGRATEQMFQEKAQQLNLWLQERGYIAASKPYYLFYNDPSTPGFLRRNEVLYMVQNK